MNGLLISKYKPYTIDEFTTEENLKTVLKTLITVDDLNILLVGDPCSGKTNLLHAIIRQYYELSTHESFPEHNILYINNLKEQGISFYRNEMKTFSQTRSSIYGKKKTIIIDDIDTINEQGQQVFRNYIDKYRNNINFVSVCTNIQKVIESIQSRVHMIRLEPPSPVQIQQVMETIIEKERMQISEDSKSFILGSCNYSIREMINMLEQIYLYAGTNTETNIELQDCKILCFDERWQTFETYVAHLKEHRIVDAIYIMYEFNENGFSVIDILEYFFNFTKKTKHLSETCKYEIIKLLCKYISIYYNTHENVLELALMTNEIYSVLRSSMMEEVAV